MRLSTSRASCFLQCPKKYFYNYVLEREPIEVDGNLALGTAWHSMLEARYKGIPVPTPERNPAGRVGTHEITLLKAMYDVYSERYKYSDQALKVLEVEVDREVPFRGHTLTAKMDMVTSAPGGGVWLWDHKTTRSNISPGSMYWENLILDQQISFYWLAALEMGYDVEGFVYNVAKVPALKRTKKETPEQFTNRCERAIYDDPDGHFMREKVTRTAHDIENARMNFDGIVALASVEQYPQNPGSCFKWGRRCEFHDVCSGVAKISDNSMFKTKEPR